MNPICPYCGKESHKEGGRAVYPHREDLWHKKFYVCQPCKAFVGCHPGSNRPLGTLANVVLRQRRLRAHKRFDPIWKSRKLTRTQAYTKLSGYLGIPTNECHIGMFNDEQCKKTIEFVDKFYP